MKYSTTDIVQGGKSYIPTQTYRVRINDTDLGTASGGYPMTKLSLEIIEPEEVVDHNGNRVKVAGRPFSMWLLHNIKETWGQANVVSFCEKLGIELNGEYDDALHKEYFKGMEFDMVLGAEESILRYPKNHPEPDKRGKSILDGEGREIKDGWQIKADIQKVLPAGQNRASKNEAIAGAGF